MASHARSFRLYLPSAASSSKAQIPEIINSLQTSEKVLSIELMPSNSLDISAISKLHPTFCSVIWRHSERFNYKKPNEIEPLALSKHLLDSGHNVLLHLAGRYLKREEAVSVLDEAKRIGVRNIFALKGGNAIRKNKNHNSQVLLCVIMIEYIKFFENCGKQYDFEEATDLIKFIKERYQDYFSICVAGYPDRHPRCETFEEDTQNLIKKVNKTCHGLNFATVQFFLDRGRRRFYNYPGSFQCGEVSALHSQM